MIIRHVRAASFFVNDAVKYGVDEAIFLKYLYDEISDIALLKQNQKGEQYEMVIIGGEVWAPWTLKELSQALPWWTTKQLRRIVESCISQGLIKPGNYNQNPMDQRLWYTVCGGWTVDDEG